MCHSRLRMLLSFRDTDAPTIIIAEKDAVMIKDAARESLRLNCGARRGGRYLGPGGRRHDGDEALSSGSTRITGASDRIFEFIDLEVG